MIHSSIQKTKVKKGYLLKFEYSNNESKLNNQNDDINDMGSAFVKDKYNTHPSEANEDTEKGGKKVQKNKDHRIKFKVSMQYHNIGLILILTVLKTIL